MGFPQGSLALATSQVGLASARPSAGSVAKGYLYYATDTNALSESDGVSTWTTIATGGGGLTAIPIVSAEGDHSGNNFTTSSTTHVDFTGASALWNLSTGGTNANGQLSIAAATNDILEVFLTGFNGGTDAVYFGATIGGTLLSNAITVPTNAPLVFIEEVTVTAGMISGGTVACKPQFWDPSAGGVAILNRATTNPLAPLFVVKNLKH